MRKTRVLVALLMSSMVFAETKPVMLSLLTPVQWPDKDVDVRGLRLSLLYGECDNFKGVDIGLVNRTNGDFSGLAIGGGNIADGTVHGVQLGIVNWNQNGSVVWGKRSIGAQLGIVNYSDTFCGVQSGYVNVSGSTFTGVQHSFFNNANDVEGLQCGAWLILGVNMAYGNVTGCQIGIVNYANTMVKGLQIGLVNVIANNGWAPVLPIINGNF